VKALFTRFLFVAGLIVLALGLIALGHFTGPKRHVGPERQLTINGNFVISTNASKPINIILLDENDKPWGCSVLSSASQSSSSISANALPGTLRLRAALGGRIESSLPGGATSRITGFITTPVQGSVDFVGDAGQDEASILTSGMKINVRITESDYGIEIVFDSMPISATPTKPKRKAP